MARGKKIADSPFAVLLPLAERMHEAEEKRKEQERKKRESNLDSHKAKLREEADKLFTKTLPTSGDAETRASDREILYADSMLTKTVLEIQEDPFSEKSIKKLDSIRRKVPKITQLHWHRAVNGIRNKAKTKVIQAELQKIIDCLSERMKRMGGNVFNVSIEVTLPLDGPPTVAEAPVLVIMNNWPSPQTIDANNMIHVEGSLWSMPAAKVAGVPMNWKPDKAQSHLSRYNYVVYGQYPLPRPMGEYYWYLMTPEGISVSNILFADQLNSATEQVVRTIFGEQEVEYKAISRIEHLRQKILLQKQKQQRLAFEEENKDLINQADYLGSQISMTSEVARTFNAGYLERFGIRSSTLVNENKVPQYTQINYENEVAGTRSMADRRKVWHKAVGWTREAVENSQIAHERSTRIIGMKGAHSQLHSELVQRKAMALERA